jgi:hypothetical protein
MRKESIEGLAYPTIALNGENCNLVFKSSVLDEKKLRLKYVDWIKIVDIVEGVHVFKEIDFSNKIGSDGFIYWKGRSGGYDVNNNPGWVMGEVSGYYTFLNAVGEELEKC